LESRGGDEDKTAGVAPAAAPSRSHLPSQRSQADAHDFGAFFGDQRRKLSVLV
jgi:hypothetical protein